MRFFLKNVTGHFYFLAVFLVFRERISLDVEFEIANGHPRELWKFSCRNILPMTFQLMMHILEAKHCLCGGGLLHIVCVGMPSQVSAVDDIMEVQ